VKSVRKLCRRTRRRWIAERSLRGLARTLAWTLNGCLLCLVLHHLVDLPRESLLGVAGMAAAAAAVGWLRLVVAAPRGSTLAQLVDQRAGTGDLFASAVAFRRDPVRFGWLGELTCQRAAAEAARTVIPARWSFGPARPWILAVTAAVLLAGADGVTVAWRWFRPQSSAAPAVARANPQPRPSVASGSREEKPPVKEPAEEKSPARDLTIEETPPQPPPAESVKITNEMVDRFLQQVPEDDKVNLEGVTPIRWDEDEASGKANPQNQRKEGEKIDPVKLDAAFLKDLTKAEGGKEEGGVDIAVMGQANQPTPAKGKTGGKEGQESLAGAVSKDPRGNPTRMAVHPARQGLQVTSVSRAPSREKGQVRPMQLLEFLLAQRRAESLPDEPDRDAAPAAGRSPEEVISAEPVDEAAGPLLENYFSRLREAER
jgi:hypothetical protein